MQNGKIYVKGNRWYFRYQEPATAADGQKVWKDRYLNLAPKEQYSSALAVEKDHGDKIQQAIGKTAQMTPSTIQPVTEFIENVFFVKKQEILRPSTVHGYKHVYDRHLKTRLMGLRLCDVDLSKAQSILKQIAQETATLKSSSNIRHAKWFMVSVYNLAAQENAFNPNLVNPFFKVDINDIWKPLQVHRRTKPTRYATVEDVVAMIDVLEEPAATVVAVAAFSGLRKSEIQALRWEDLTPGKKGEEGQLMVRRTAWRTTDVRDQTKSDASTAPVPVIPILARHLEAHRNGFPANGFIFTGPKMGRPLDLHNLAVRIIRPALAKKNIPWCGYHGFRRGLATNLYTLKTPPQVIQGILRHADVSVTEKHYIKVVDSVSQAAMAKVDKVFESKLKAAKRKYGTVRKAGGKS